MSLPVLQPVRRRRPRRARTTLFTAALIALLIAIAIGLLLGREGGGGAQSAPSPQQASAVASESPQHKPPRRRNLLYGLPLSSKAFRPPLGARAAIVVSAQTGRVIWAKSATKRLPIASTTKIMTAHLVLQRLGLNKVVRVDPGVERVPLVKEGLRPGERVPVWKLLDGLLLYSGNDDALALAAGTSGSRSNFVRLMNSEAHRLHLDKTHFRSPSGVIDRDNYSTAADLAALTRVALDDGRFRRIVRTRIARVRWPPPTYGKVYVNKNRLLTLYRGADGVKTGWTTKAGHCLVASATRHHLTLIAVVLHSDRPYNDAARLLNLGFKTVRR